MPTRKAPPPDTGPGDDSDLLVSIDSLIPKRKKIKVEGQIYEARTIDEQGLLGIRQLVKFSQSMSGFEMDSLIDLSLPESDFEAMVNAFRESVDGVIEWAYIDVPKDFREQWPFEVRQRLAVGYLSYFSDGLGPETPQRRIARRRNGSLDLTHLQAEVAAEMDRLNLASDEPTGATSSPSSDSGSVVTSTSG